YNAFKDALEAGLKGKNPTKGLSDVQMKAALTTTGYATGGLPTNAIWNLIDFMQSKPVRKTGKVTKEMVKDLKEVIDLYIDDYKDDPEAEKFINDLREYKDQMLPVTDVEINEVIPEDTKDVFKQALSKGEWDAYDNETGAAGI